jgi:hypothetical protein
LSVEGKKRINAEALRSQRKAKRPHPREVQGEQKESVLLQAADPDAGSRGLAEVKSAVGAADGESFIVFAAGDRELGAGVEMQVVEEFQEFTILFVDADDFGPVVSLQIGEQHGALFAELRDAAS